MDSPPPQRWDRGKWITVFSSHSPTIREVTECLGLGLSPSASTTNRGIPKFDAPEFKKLSSEVTRISKELPQDRDGLLDFAADPNCLDEELNALLASLGPAIWGKDADRTRLVTPDPAKKTYCKDLFYEDTHDRDIIKTHLQRWIVIKACYYIRNRKLKKPSIGEDYESLADIDTGSPATTQKPELESPSITPQGSPPERAVTPIEDPEHPTNLRKRKSSIFQFGSDAENNDTPSGPVRKRSHQTLSIQRKSPRRLGTTAPKFSSDVVPPIPTMTNRLELPAASTASPIGARAGLSPLSSNALNGVARPSVSPTRSFSGEKDSGSPKRADSTPNAFAPVNASINTKIEEPNSNAFATVNATGIARPVDAPCNSFPDANASSTPKHADISHSASAATNTASGPGPAAPKPSSFVTASSHEMPKPSEVPSKSVMGSSTFSGFTAINTPGSASIPIAPTPGGYASPYETPDAHQQGRTPVGTTATNDHIGTTTRNTTPVQRELSPQKIQSVRHASDSHLPPQAYAPIHAAIAPHPGFGMQSTFQSHSTPTTAAPHHPRVRPAMHTPILTNGSGGHNGHMLPSNAPTASPINAHHYPERRSISRAASPTDATLRQCELLGMLIQYLFPRDRPRLDEKILLSNLAYVWQMNAHSFQHTMGDLYQTQTDVLFTWMEEQSKIVQLQHAMDSQPALTSLGMVDRLLAMNDLRVMRLKWKLMRAQDGHHVLSSEDLLCRTFAVMTKTEGTETMFREGLEKLNETMFSFLRSNDMKIKLSWKESK